MFNRRMVLYFSLLLSAINSLKVDKYATLIQDREFQKDDAPKNYIQSRFALR
jgi:hypothetical protein